MKKSDFKKLEKVITVIGNYKPREATKSPSKMPTRKELRKKYKFNFK